MNRNHLWKLLIIIFVIAWSAFEIYPPTGMSIIEVFREEGIKKDSTFSNIVERAQQLQKENPNRPLFSDLKEAVGTNEIARYFPFDVKGEKDPNSAVLYRLQQDAAGKIKLGLDLQGGTSFLVAMDTNKLGQSSQKDTALANAVEVIRKRVDKLGVAEPLIQPVGTDKILIQLPGLSEAAKDSARRQIQKAAFLEFRKVHPNSDELLAQNIVPPGYEILRAPSKDANGNKTMIPYIVERAPATGMIGTNRVALTGKYVKQARPERDPVTNDPEIRLDFNSEGAELFAQITRELAPKGNKHFYLAIVLDGELYSAPRILGEIPGGSARITGSFEVSEAIELANVLENPLEAPVEIRDERSVDPSLGKDTIKSGVNSAIYGTIAVAGFMAIYYLFAGMVANIALITNIILLFGVMCYSGATLTLPGIAGIVLTVGMAVDANVLIFERIREESAKGKSLRGALAAGYSRAFGTIFDSHVTTLISSIILWNMGTGSIQGFGFSLTWGVAASLFTALVVTRLIFDFLLAKNWLKSLPMLHIIRSAKLNFMALAKPAFVLSWTIILVGIGYGLIARGHNLLGTDFAGGDKLSLRFAPGQKVEVEKLRSAITKAGISDPLIQYQRDLTGGPETLQVTSAFQTSEKVESALKTDFPAASFERTAVDKIGPTIGAEIQRTAIIASLLSLFGILVYVAFRYEFSFAVGAVLAVIHDVLMTFGCYFLAGRQLNATTIAAILTIIGFSTNDTIVIFDRIREDLKLGVRGSFRDVINQALNQTLSRTIITSGTVFLATLALFIFGGGAINDFAFTFLVGIITGTYSSIYIASALVLWWHGGNRPKTGSQVVMESSETKRDERMPRVSPSPSR